MNCAYCEIEKDCGIYEPHDCPNLRELEFEPIEPDSLADCLAEIGGLAAGIGSLQGET